MNIQEQLKEELAKKDIRIKELMTIKCKEGYAHICPYVKTVSFTPDSELADKVIKELQAKIDELERYIKMLEEGYM